MQNPISYIKECIGKVKAIDKDIESKQEEIKRCQNRLDEIEFKKESTSFKWYEIKDKSDFTDDLKSKKKLLKATISKLKKEIKYLETQRKEAEAKKENAIILACVAIFVIILVLSVTIGSLFEKDNPQPKPETTTIVDSIETSTVDDTTETTTSITTTEKELTELKSSFEELTLEVDEVCDNFYFSGSVDESIELIPVVENKDIAEVEIIEYDYSKVSIKITGLSEGETMISLKSKDGMVVSNEVSVEVIEPETITEFITEATTSRAEKIVYGSRTGNHYHNGSCRYANGQEFTIEQAERKGWDACRVCNP